MKQSSRPNQEHAYSRYFRFTDDALDRLQQDYLAGRDLGQSIPGISATEAAVIVAESLEADELWATLPQRLLEGAPPAPRGKPLSDWSRAVMAELFFAVAEQARAQGNKKQERNAWALAWAALEEVTKSPDASPMLWYEGLFFDVSQQLRMTGERQALELLKQALAHNLRYNDGNNADSILRDLAETHLWLDDLDEGLAMLAALLRNDPADVWTYNLMAITFDRFGLAEVGAEATRRGLELVEATGDPERLRQQLRDALERLQKSERRGREAKVDAAVLAELRAAPAILNMALLAENLQAL